MLDYVSVTLVGVELLKMIEDGDGGTVYMIEIEYDGAHAPRHKVATGEFGSQAAVAAKITEMWGVVPLDLEGGSMND